METGGMRVDIVVRPHASRAHVGGTHDGALVVHVTAPPSEGRATREALRALAAAFDVRPGAVTLRHGATSRRKVVEITVDPERGAHLQARLRDLLRADD
jgi:hypothetical protein